MKRSMHPVSVSTTNDGEIEITQQWTSFDEDSQVISITPDQASIVATWLLDASEESYEPDSSKDEEDIPIKFFGRGPEAEHEDLSIFNNKNGMVVLRISDDYFFEVSPVMAKRLRNQLSKAISNSYMDMMRDDGEI